MYDQLDNVTLDPDASVRAAIEYLFKCFEQTASAHAVVKQFAAEGLKFPGRHGVGGPHAGELYWKPLRHDMVLFTLHNPRYAGAYFYGRRKTFTDIDGHTRTVVKPRDQWTVLICDAHPGYITFEQYEQHQQTLAANAAAHSDEERRAGPAREGPALLQGLVVCGKCGKRMTVNYHARCNGELVPNYHCSREGIATGTPPCQTINGAGVDQAVATLVLEQLTPLAIEAALAVSTELAQRAADADRIRQMGVQRAEHAADTARRRYLAVDPTNRLVADQLEADWNNKLRELADAKDAYERATQDGNRPLTGEQQARIRALATDLPALWANPATPMRERKRLIRLLLIDVTLIDAGEQITTHVRLQAANNTRCSCHGHWRVGAAHHPTSTIELIEQLLDEHTYDQTVEILNQQGLTGGWGNRSPSPRSPSSARTAASRPTVTGSALTACSPLKEIATQFSVTTDTIKTWQRRGHITGRRIDRRRLHLYHPGQNRPPDGRQRPKPTTRDIVAATRHHRPGRLAEGIPTTTTPGGAV